MDKKVIVFGVDGLIPELVYKFSKEGVLPHISKMMTDGATIELLPFISTWGDLNWVSFLTGQSPGICWKGQSIPPNNNENMLGYLDQRGKKCALVHFPESLSVEGTHHFSFAPFWSRKGSPPFEAVPSAIFSTDPGKWPRKDRKEYLGWPPMDALAHHEKRHILPIHHDDSNSQLKFSIPNYEDVRIYSISESEIQLNLSEGKTVVLRLNDWSPWITVKVQNKFAHVRFKLLFFDFNRMEIDILQSQINYVQGYSDNQSLEQYLLETYGPFISKWTVKADPDELYHETSFEEANYQAYWLAEAALGLLKDQSFDLFATVFRLNDETHHTCLGEYDPSSPFFSPSRSAVCEEVMRKSYKLLDRVIGKLLREKSEDTLLILASDHGNIPNQYLCDINRRLEQCGLCRLDEQGALLVKESKAYLKNERGGLEIYVNLKGQDATGIVEKEDYSRVQTEISSALTTWYYETPQGVRNVTAIVLKKQDAAMIGYGGPEMGDVIFAYNQGFVWGTNDAGDVIAPVTAPGANHGPQIPTASTDYSSNYGISVFYGPQIMIGAFLSRSAQNRMNDVGTTIAKFLGIEDGTGLDGRCLQVFSETEGCL